MFRELLNDARTRQPSSTMWIALCSTNLGSSLSAQSKDAEAEPMLREALAVELKEVGARDSLTKVTVTALANTLDRTGRAAEAKTLRASAGLATPSTKPTTRSARTRPTTAASTTKP